MKYNKDGSITKVKGVKRKDLTGQLFGELKVLKRLECGPKKVKWLCECIITGQTRNVLMSDLLSGKVTTRSNKHGLSKHELYETWEQMIQRCTNPNHKSYSNYGDRGISFCPTWKEFPQFLRDMGERPKGMTLERKNNNKGYSKRNCKWATRTEQNSNTRRNRILKFKGENYTMKSFGEKFNVSAKMLSHYMTSKGKTFNETLKIMGVV